MASQTTMYLFHLQFPIYIASHCSLEFNGVQGFIETFQEVVQQYEKSYIDQQSKLSNNMLLPRAAHYYQRPFAVARDTSNYTTQLRLQQCCQRFILIPDLGLLVTRERDPLGSYIPSADKLPYNTHCTHLIFNPLEIYHRLILSHLNLKQEK